MAQGAPTDGLRETVSSEEAYSLHQGNSLELTSILGDYFTRDVRSNLIDVTITSPPYADLKLDQYESEKAKQIGVEDSYDEYLDNLRLVFKQVYDVTKADGTLWVIVNSFKENGRVVRLPQDIVGVCENLPDRRTCQECGAPLVRNKRFGGLWCPECDATIDTRSESWTLHDLIIWNKRRARPYSGQGTFRNVFEYILFFKKSDTPAVNLDRVRVADPSELSHWWVDWPERYNPRGKVPENIWDMITPTQGQWGDLTLDHPAPFPPDLVERIVEFTTKPGDVVMDPFAGTGMTVAQASAMDRHGIGIELSEQYCDKFGKLRDEIQEKWETAKDEGETLDQQQAELSRVIWGLRQLVYARKLLLAFRRDRDADSISDLGSNTIFVISKNTDPDVDDEPVSVEIYFVFDDHKLIEDQANEINQLLESYHYESPWRGFELDVSATAITISTLSHDYAVEDVSWTDERLYLYHGCEHYQFSRSIEFNEWQSKATQFKDWRRRFATPEYPPTISNLSIHVNREGEAPSVSADPLREPPAEQPDEIDYSIQADEELTRTTLDDY